MNSPYISTLRTLSIHIWAYLIISQVSSAPTESPAHLPELECMKINETLNATFFNDEKHKGCGPYTVSVNNGCPIPLGNNTFSSLKINVQDPRESKNMCLALFSHPKCKEDNPLIVRNSIEQFGNWNDAVRCFRICNDKERKEEDLNGKSVSKSAIVTRTTTARNIQCGQLTFSFFTEKEFEGSETEQNLINYCDPSPLAHNSFSSLKFKEQDQGNNSKSVCLVLFSDMECTANPLVVTENIKNLNQTVKCFRMCHDNESQNKSTQNDVPVIYTIPITSFRDDFLIGVNTIENQLPTTQDYCSKSYDIVKLVFRHDDSSEEMYLNLNDCNCKTLNEDNKYASLTVTSLKNSQENVCIVLSSSSNCELTSTEEKIEATTLQLEGIQRPVELLNIKIKSFRLTLCDSIEVIDNGELKMISGSEENLFS